jgi:hypothetical protein
MWSTTSSHALQAHTHQQGLSAFYSGQQLSAHVLQHRRPKQHVRSTAVVSASASAQAGALNQQQVAQQLRPPPAGYDYKAEIMPETLEIVQQQYPQLMGLVEAGG